MARTRIGQPASPTPDMVDPPVSNEVQQGDLGARLPPLVQADGEVVDSVAPEGAQPQVPRPKKYLVLQDRRVVIPGGFSTLLREGKRLDERHYNVPRLLEQGLKLRELGEDE